MGIETAERLTPGEAGWVAALREVLPTDLSRLCLAPDDWYQGMEVRSSDGRCPAWFDLIVDGGVALTFGAYFDGERTVVGCLHSQLFDLAPQDRRVPQETFGGPVAEQAARTCDRFMEVGKRPVERREWSPTVYEYRFADDGTSLVNSRDFPLRQGPPGTIIRVDTRVT